MMLDLTFGRPDLARRIGDAVDRTLTRRVLTPDLGGSAGTTEMTEAIAAELAS